MVDQDYEYSASEEIANSFAGMLYTDFLGLLNDTLSPRSYFEIGTSSGDSLRRFKCNAVCIDPKFQLTGNPVGDKEFVAFFQLPSDIFFANYDVKAYFSDGPDISFLDGMHRFEYLLRDFLNTERSCHKRSLIILHDCLPLNTRMAERAFRLSETESEGTRSAWTGDVWKILPVLKKYRPDLRVRLLDCPQTGLVAITSLNPSSDTLQKSYDLVIEEFRDLELTDFGISNLRSLYPMLESRKLSNPTIMSTHFSLY